MTRILRFDEMYEYEDFTMSDMEIVKELWNDGMTEIGQLALECDLTKATIRQILYTLSKRNEISGYTHNEPSVIEESLPSDHNLKQLRQLRKKTKGVDIGDRIPNLKKQGANIHFDKNVIDSDVETQEDFEKHNKKFISGWNTKHLISPFSGEK